MINMIVYDKDGNALSIDDLLDISANMIYKDLLLWDEQSRIYNNISEIPINSEKELDVAKTIYKRYIELCRRCGGTGVIRYEDIPEFKLMHWEKKEVKVKSCDRCKGTGKNPKFYS